MATWNLWHGCHRVSPACANCYMFYLDEQHRGEAADSETIYRTKQFYYPLERNRKGEYKMKSGESILVNMTSDTFLEEADPWRDEMWAIIKQRPDVRFELITKRPERIMECLPADWGEGYDNVMICATCETQKMLDLRLPIMLQVPCRHKGFLCVPMLEPINAEKFLATGQFQFFAACGEFYGGERPLDFDWIRDLVRQSEKYRVNFNFGEIGNHFIKDGKHYGKFPIEVQRAQSRKAGMNRTYYKIDYGQAGLFIR